MGLTQNYWLKTSGLGLRGLWHRLLIWQICSLFPACFMLCLTKFSARSGDIDTDTFRTKRNWTIRRDIQNGIFLFHSKDRDEMTRHKGDKGPLTEEPQPLQDTTSQISSIFSLLLRSCRLWDLSSSENLILLRPRFPQWQLSLKATSATNLLGGERLREIA